jgi:hypothetical protein
MNTFSTASVIQLTHIKRDMLNYLCRAGIVTPTLSRKQGKRGHGIERRYSFTDVVSLKVVQKLAASGVQPLKVKKAIRELHQMGISINRLPSSHVVIVNKSVYQWQGKGDPFRVVDGQMAFGFILDVSAIRSELIRDIQRLVA